MKSGLGAHPRITLAIACTLYGLSLVLIDVAPFFVGMYNDTLRISLSQAGFVQTIDQAGGVVGAVLGFILMPRAPWRLLILGASLAATVANALTGMADSYLLLCSVRFASGLSVVLLTTVCACIMARATVPDRAFGAGMAISLLLSAAAIWLLDALREYIGYGAALSSGALWLGAAVFLSLLLPAGLRGGTVDLGSRDGEGTRLGAIAFGKIALVGLLLFAVGANVVSGFTERVGLANGLNPAQVANAAAFSYILSIVAVLIPTAVGVIGGRLKWIAFTTLLFFGAIWALYESTTTFSYTIAFAAYLSAWGLGLTYYMSLVADNDPDEKFTRMIYIINVAAQAIGPAIGAMLVAKGSLSIVLLAAPFPAAAALVIIAVYAARRPHEAARVPAAS